jgi:D-lactate dehydrogenase
MRSRLGVLVVRAFSHSLKLVAEHTTKLILGVNRHIASTTEYDHNFSLDGLVGFDLKDKTVGVVGTGKIGALVARLVWHFRCRVLAFDPVVDETLVELGVTYVGPDEMWPQCDIISLNAPLLDTTYHLVNADTIARCKRGFMLVNTAAGR